MPKVNIKKEQLDFLDWELGVFFHFGIRTFYEGHVDWDMKEMPLSGFNPPEVDCENWIKTVKESGAKYAILVCKHHDGFANWPSKYTDYSVKNTPWLDGKGDVVRLFVDACRKYDIKVGLYYSPAQFGSNKMNGKEYDDYFINQISELLTNYGKIDYLWFDGCGSEGHEYDTVRIVKAIRSFQPEILIFNMWDPDTRWVGNESGVAPLYNNNIRSELSGFSINKEEGDKLENYRFLPAECDVTIRAKNWFYSDSDGHTLKSLDELMGLYYASVGRGANLLINIGPGRDGKLPEADAKRYIEFGKKVEELFSEKYEVKGTIEKSENGYNIVFDDFEKVNHIVLCEEIDGESEIEDFELRSLSRPHQNRVIVYHGATVGHKRICAFPTMDAKKIEVVLDKDKKVDIKAYYVPMFS